MKKLLALLVALVLCLTCLAACGTNNNGDQTSSPTQLVYNVDDAAAYLKNMYKKYLVENETAADFSLVSQIMKGGVIYTITWTTDREDIKVILDEENKQVIIDLDEQTKVDIEYKLTATIKDPDGKTATLTFELKVPKYMLSSWSQYMAAPAGKSVIIQGYIAAIHSKSEGNKYNQLYIHDANNKGGYYIYSTAGYKDPITDLNLKEGMLVSVTGTKDIYSGTHELKDATVTVLNETPVHIKPLDITNIYKEATSLKDAKLVSKLGMLVTIKGVEITDQNLAEKSMYMNFKLSGLTSYIRVYATDCPASVSDAGQKRIISKHAAKQGYEADVTGIVVQYNGAIYLNPVSENCFKYGNLIERNDEEKVQFEIDELLFEKDVPLNKTLNVPSQGSTYEDVKITWVSNSDAITISNGKAKITLQSEATTASMTGTFTLNDVTKVVTYEFKLSAKPSVVAQAVDNPVAGTAYKLYMVQMNRGETLYFTGEMNGHYGDSTTDPNAAVDIYVEPSNGGYYIYFNKGGVKNYINIVQSGTYVNFVFQTDKPATPFTLDASLGGAPVMAIGDTTYFMGTYSEYFTFGTSKYSYADTNFITYIGTVVDTSAVSDDEKIATEMSGLTVESEFFTDAEIDLATKGTIYNEVAITWTSNSEYAVVNGGKLNITIPTAATTVTLTAKLTCGNTTQTKTFEIALTVVSTEAFAPSFVGLRPEEGKAYKYAVYQAKKGTWLYADGTFGERYLNTTENYNEGVDYYAELVSTDVYKFYILDGTTKLYLTVYQNDAGKDSVKFDANGTNTYTYDATTGAWVTNFNGTDYYVGTYNDFATLSVSKTSYINAENTGVSQFPGAPVELAIVETALKTNTAYKFAFFQGDASLNKMLYVDGGLDAEKSRYFTTTDDPGKAIDIYIEEATGGFKFYTLEGTTKKYVVAYLDGNSKTSLKFDSAESTVFTFNGTLNIWSINLGGTDYYMGTYNNYQTVSLSKNSFINAENTGVSQFPLNLVAAKFAVATTGDDNNNEGGNEGGETTTTMPYTLGKEYFMELNQETAGKYIYLNGEMSSNGNYLATTTDTTAAVKVVLEADGDGYQMYYMNGSTKTYITIIPSVGETKTYYNLKFVTDKPSIAWVWNADLGTFTLAVDGTSYFIGTYNNYETLSACNVTYTTNFKVVFVENATGNEGGNSGNEGGNTGNEGGNTGGNITGGDIVSGALAATFTLGEDDSTKTDESVQIQDGTAITTYTEDNNGYTLTLTDLAKVYGNAFDGAGNAGLKLGTSSVIGSFTFVVPENVKSVKIYVAGYKAKTSKVSINGDDAITLTKSSATGEYDVIVIDTSSVKTITFATVSGATRVKISTIEFYN